MKSAYKPRVFVASSTESLEVAYAVQENLERDAEITVWTQGVFELSKYTLDDLLSALDDIEFGVFVLAADDVVRIRGTEHVKARDNVVFELGLFIGRLGKERAFLILPRGHEDFELPTDLLGLTPATFEPNRTDDNLPAALGPACNKIRKTMGKIPPLVEAQASDGEPEPVATSEYDRNDIMSMLESWMGSRPANLNTQVIRYADIDRELGIPAGSALQYLEQAAQRWGYQVARRGTNTILFREVPKERPPRRTAW